MAGIKASKLFLAMLVVSYALCAAGNALSFKAMLFEFSKHEFFASQWNVLIYCTMAGSVVLGKRLQYGRRWLMEQPLRARQISWMAVFDCASSLLACFGGAQTEGGVQNILNQALIPMTLALSTLALGTRYAAQQYAGAAVIMAGAVVAVLPAVLYAGGGADASTTLMGASLYTCSVLPSALSNVYKEVVFREKNAEGGPDVFVLTTAVSTFQVVVGFGFLPLLRLPAFGGLALSQIPSELSGGWSDFCTPSGAGYMLSYCMVNFGFNILQLVITKYADATLLAFCTALALPATSLLFSSSFIMGDHAERFSWSDAVALVLVIAGFLVYSCRRDHESLLLPQAAPGSGMYIPVATVMRRSESDPALSGGLLDLTEQSPARASSQISLRDLARVGSIKRQSSMKRQDSMPRKPLSRADSITLTDRLSRTNSVLRSSPVNSPLVAARNSSSNSPLLAARNSSSETQPLVTFSPLTPKDAAAAAAAALQRPLPSSNNNIPRAPRPTSYGSYS